MTSRLVIIVEDDPTLRAVLTILLERDGWRVSEAGDGRAGLECALTADPDLVITDLRMPRMSGLALARALGVSDRVADVPVLGISASPSELQRAAEEPGLFAALLRKPITPRDLLETVRQLTSPSEGE